MTLAPMFGLFGNHSLVSASDPKIEITCGSTVPQFSASTRNSTSHTYSPNNVLQSLIWWTKSPAASLYCECIPTQLYRDWVFRYCGSIGLFIAVFCRTIMNLMKEKAASIFVNDYALAQVSSETEKQADISLRRISQPIWNGSLQQKEWPWQRWLQISLFSAARQVI